MGCSGSKSAAEHQDEGRDKSFTDMTSGSQQQQQAGGGGGGASHKHASRYGGAATSSSAAAGAPSSASLGPVHSDIVFSLCAGDWSGGNDSAPRFFSGSEDRSLAEWGAGGLVGVHPAAHARCISALAYAPQSRTLYSASRDKLIKQWTLPPSAGVAAAASSSSSAGWSLTPGHTFSGHTLPVSCISLNACDPLQLVSGARDYQVRLWDTATGSALFWTEVQQNVVTDLCWLHRGEPLVLQASEDLTLRVWDMRTKAEAQSFSDGPYFALHCDVSADNNYFLTGHNGFESVGCELKMFDRRTGRKVADIQAASQAITDARFVHVEGAGAGGSGQLYAASSSKDGTLKLWDLEALLQAGEDTALSGRPVAEGLVAAHHLDLSESVQSIAGAAPAPAGSNSRSGHATLATGHINGRVSVWDVDVQRKQFHLLMHSQGADNN